MATSFHRLCHPPFEIRGMIWDEAPSLEGNRSRLMEANVADRNPNAPADQNLSYPPIPCEIQLLAGPSYPVVWLLGTLLTTRQDPSMALNTNHKSTGSSVDHLPHSNFAWSPGNMASRCTIVFCCDPTTAFPDARNPHMSTSTQTPIFLAKALSMSRPQSRFSRVVLEVIDVDSDTSWFRQNNKPVLGPCIQRAEDQREDVWLAGIYHLVDSLRHEGLEEITEWIGRGGWRRDSGYIKIRHPEKIGPYAVRYPSDPDVRIYQSSGDEWDCELWEVQLGYEAVFLKKKLGVTAVALMELGRAEHGPIRLERFCISLPRDLFVAL
ncbi:hypothetical protein QBC36DRAFT_309457 [Triangularia setosa]|uniref:Uncharacterized protein n=1 Tax=Triangularia setosa TaxID=2587417 RepID=A0AAN7A9K0_9PEZI|nr:hypothetical protein QBC36DRAFT_309457 [Podospora setosa]